MFQMKGNKFMSETIHVAYYLDDGYMEPTYVSMASMLANTKP